ncbi:uncharacterized protein Triagg1_4212 [Trichoderma aggressivum f. europaeum]|uniref:Uncharacterized protein n=1 Tax=Trichoderma aggressivum f. europaeum TaxID=173218 RepID=A0AAE1J828_9HYPO|nr:hypothetical protein Triagg1_4212 [Trichoderma aggressivum f. europaeum]
MLPFGQKQLVLVHAKLVSTGQQERDCCSTKRAVRESMCVSVRPDFAYFELDYMEDVEDSWADSAELVPEQEEEGEGDRTELEPEEEGGTNEMGSVEEDTTEVDSEESTCKMDSAEEDKTETGSAEALSLQGRELSMPERMSTRNVQAAVDQEGVDNTAPVRLHSDTAMQEEAPFGIHNEFAAGGSRLHMDIGHCLRMSALAGHWSVSAGWEEEQTHCHIEEAAAVAAGSSLT